MEATEFFRVVLPPEGPYSLRVKTDRYVKTYYYDTIEKMVVAALRFDAKGHTVWYSTGSLRDKTSAAGANIKAKMVYHIDLDVEEHKGYRTPKLAVDALAAACKNLNLPAPLLVRSGKGFHVYWRLTEPVAPEVWQPTAERLKAALLAEGMKIDAGVTANVALVLRVPGTHHRKTDTPLPVYVAYAGADPVTQEDFAARLGMLDPLDGADAVADMFAPKTDLAAEPEYPPSDADAVAEHCAFIRAFKETGFGGGGLEPEWHDAIGVVKYCIDGEKKCHEYSAVAVDDYSPEETQKKIDLWRTGPTTCKHIRDNDRQGYCKECTLHTKYTSPIQLGVKAAEVSQLVQQQSTPLSGPWWPKRAGWDEVEQQMYFERFNPDDATWERVHFCTTKFYVESRILTEDESWAFLVHRLKYIKNGKEVWDTFHVPTSLVAKPNDLAVAFAKREVYVANRIGPNALAELLKQYGDALRHRCIEIGTHNVMGWHTYNENLDMHEPTYPLHADGFIIGNRRITADGEETVLLGEKMDAEWRNGFGSAGTPSEWAKMVHEIYVEPGAIPYQFVILTEFAAPLISLFCRDEYHGHTIILTGQSGWAKTSTSEVALSIWGNPSALKVSGNGTQGSTIYSIMGSISRLRHMSLLIDEVTKLPPHIVGEMIYAIAMGKDRKRLWPDGKPRPMNSPWSSLTKVTSNNPVLQRVLEDERDTDRAGDAMQNRIFEVNFDRLPYEKESLVRDPETAIKVETLKTTQYGTIGPVWVRYLLRNKETVVHDLDANLRHCRLKSIDFSTQRFSDYLEAAILTACQHVSKCGIMFPDTEGVLEFIRAVRNDMMDMRADNQVPMVDAFSRYLAQNQGGILVTDRFPTGKGRTPDAHEFPKRELHGELLGRVALKDNFAALAVGPLKDWCRMRSIDFRRMIRDLDDEGYFIHSPKLVQLNDGKADPLKTAVERLNLARGTGVIATRTKCFRVDLARIMGKPSLREVTTEKPQKEQEAASKAH